MCGITGFYSQRIRRPIEILAKMEEAIKHRGPDAKGEFFDRNFAIGIRRLSIIDLAGGNQPIYNEDKSIAVVFNGEIYDFAKLRKKLESRGHLFSTKTDTEVLVHLYEESKEKLLEQISGMFAFCIYDKRAREILIARDRLGKKPLYYYFQNKEFVFASEIKSILLFPRFPKKISERGMIKYFSFGYTPAPQTLFKNVKSLPPGFYLKLNLRNLKLEVKRYWNLKFTPKTKSPEKELVFNLERKISAAVEKRLVSDVPLGVFLSGGLDSSLVVAMMSKFLKGKKLKTFSIGFEEKEFNESNFAQIVARRYNTDHHLKIFKVTEVLDILSEILEKMDEPLAEPSILPTYLLSKFTKTKVSVALSGDGGDEAFGGYPKYYIHRYAAWYDLLPRVIKNNLAAKLTTLLPLKPKNKIFNYKTKRFIACLPYPPRYRNQFWVSPFTPQEVKNDLLPAQKIDNKLFREDVDFLLRDHQQDKANDQMIYLDTKLMLADMYLHKVDRQSMAHSLEVRSPFLDKEVIEYAAQIPFEYKVRGRETKYILKKIAQKYLPKEIIYRFKKGFGLPLAKWISDLAPEILGLIHKSCPEEINKSYLTRLIREHCQGREDHAMKIWAIYIYLLWYLKFFN